MNGSDPHSILHMAKAQPQLMTQQQAMQQQQQQQLQPYQQQVHVQDPDMHVPGYTESKVGVSVFLFGGIGTWKTSWAGTWPKPVFLSVGAEGGDDALALLPEIYQIQTPRVYQIKSCKMMSEKVDLIVRNYKAWGINTVIIDSITFYSDLWIRESMEAKLRMGKKAFAMFAEELLDAVRGKLDNEAKEHAKARREAERQAEEAQADPDPTRATPPDAPADREGGAS